MENKEKELSPVNDQLFPVVSVLKEKDANAIVALKEELQDTWVKKQIFRTETEMRVSVLNDGKFPTPAAKYWQAVREQSSMLDNLIALSFDMRRNEVKRLRLLKELENETDDLRQKEIEIDLDENLFQKAQMDQVAKDRVREIQKWSEIKSELHDGSFDITSPNTHQADSLHKVLLNRAQTLKDSSDPSEIMNVIGPLTTMERLKQQNALTHQAVVEQKKLQ